MDIEDLKQGFVDLTERALPEEDVDKLIECLVEREPYAMDLINHRITFENDEIEELLSKEEDVLVKLKQERARLLEEMAKLAESRRASMAYSPIFPLPPLPVFLDKEG